MPQFVTWLTLLLGQPHLEGLAVHYSYSESPARVMRNGEPFLNAGLTCAVDVGMWDELAGKTLLVMNEDGFMTRLRVTDTGYLADVGMGYLADVGKLVCYFHSPQQGQPAFSPYPVVIDIPVDTFKAAFHTESTQLVRAWVIDALTDPFANVRIKELLDRKFGPPPEVTP